jgi:hypothetical protein
VSKRERPGPFLGADTAAEELATFARGFAFPCLDKDPAEIALESAGYPWLQSLARKHAGRAEAYLHWADANVPKMAKGARYVINQGQFDLLVRRTGSDLLRAWRDAAPGGAGRLSFGAAYRIVDALFMAIDGSEGCRHEAARQFLHVPLDGATLSPLRGIVDELLDRDFALEIPAMAPSGYVATEEQYVLLQEALSALARRAGTPPILYAYLCAAR